MRQVLTTLSVDNALSFIVSRYLSLLNNLFASGFSLKRSPKNAKENKGNAFPSLISSSSFPFYFFFSFSFFFFFFLKTSNHLPLSYLKYTFRATASNNAYAERVSSNFPIVSNFLSRKRYGNPIPWS